MSCGGAASCTLATQFTAAPTCNGTGSCVTPGAVNCGAFACTTSGLHDHCTQDSDCASGNYCMRGPASPQQTAGTCTAPISAAAGRAQRVLLRPLARTCQARRGSHGLRSSRHDAC